MEAQTRPEQASQEVQARVRASFDHQVHIVLPSRPEVSQQPSRAAKGRASPRANRR